MTIATESPQASDAGHWYDEEGNPRYDIEGRNGLRPTTLRDARKHNWGPSVSGIISMLAKPGLVYWLQDQVALAAVTLPEVQGQTASDRKQAILQDAREQVRAAAEAGREVHKALELWFSPQGDMVAYDEDKIPICEAAETYLNQLFGEGRAWQTETAFAHPLGYGGRVDMWCPGNPGVVVDFKTKDFKKGASAKSMAYLDRGLQLAAYAHGVRRPQAALVNLFVSTKVPGLILHYDWSAERERLWELFQALLSVWKLVNQYEPEWSE